MTWCLSSWSLQCREETKIGNRRTRQLKDKYSEGSKVVQLEQPQLLWKETLLCSPAHPVPRRHVCRKCVTGELVRSHEDCVMDLKKGNGCFPKWLYSRIPRKSYFSAKIWNLFFPLLYSVGVHKILHLYYTILGIMFNGKIF